MFSHFLRSVSGLRPSGTFPCASPRFWVSPTGSAQRFSGCGRIQGGGMLDGASLEHVGLSSGELQVMVTCPNAPFRDWPPPVLFYIKDATDTDPLNLSGLATAHLCGVLHARSFRCVGRSQMSLRPGRPREGAVSLLILSACSAVLGGGWSLQAEAPGSRLMVTIHLVHCVP